MLCRAVLSASVCKLKKMPGLDTDMNNSPITSIAMGKSSCVGRITVAAAGGVAMGYSKAYGVELHCLHIDGLTCIYIPVPWGCRNQNSLQRHRTKRFIDHYLHFCIFIQMKQTSLKISDSSPARRMPSVTGECISRDFLVHFSESFTPGQDSQEYSQAIGSAQPQTC